MNKFGHNTPVLRNAIQATDSASGPGASRAYSSIGNEGGNTPKFDTSTLKPNGGGTEGVNPNAQNVGDFNKGFEFSTNKDDAMAKFQADKSNTLGSGQDNMTPEIGALNGEKIEPKENAGQTECSEGTEGEGIQNASAEDVGSGETTPPAEAEGAGGNDLMKQIMEMFQKLIANVQGGDKADTGFDTGTTQTNPTAPV
jgi:hypothetical protein